MFANRGLIFVPLAMSVLALLTFTDLAPGEEKDLKRFLTRQPPTMPADAAETFRLQENFRIELVAAEPLVSSPIEMTFDEDGRLWVVEMLDYPYDERENVPAQGRIKVLEDTDGDGRPDKGTVFVDQLSWPTSLTFWQGGIFVAAAPHIHYFKDTDGDGAADQKEIVFTGFGDSNVQALISNLRWGFDHWIYGQNGGNAGRVHSNRKPDQPDVALDGRDFRFRPSGEFEPITGGSGRFSNTFDDFGRRFICSPTAPARHIVIEDRVAQRNPHLPVPALVTSITPEGHAGPVYPASLPESWRVVLTRMIVAGEVPRAVAQFEQGGRVNGFFTGAAGLTVYRGMALGPEVYGTFFLGECSQNVIHRRKLEPAGCTFIANRVDQECEFLASTDNWFRPVNFANGPDGALYVCDMYRETIEHPWSIPEEIKQHLDLTSGKERGRLWRITGETAPTWEVPHLGGASIDALVAALARPDGWWRDTALRLLYERQDKAAVPLLEGLLKHERPEIRVAALWALEGLGIRRGDAILHDPHPGVREQAVQLANVENLFDLDDPEPRVRLEQATRMGETDDPRAVDVLVRLAPNADTWLQLAIALNTRGREHKLLKRIESNELRRSLAFSVGARNQDAEINEVLELGSGATAILRGLAEGMGTKGRKLGDLPGAAAFFESAERTVLDKNKELSQRVEAAGLLAHASFPAVERGLRPLLASDTPPPLRLAAVRALTMRREPEIGALLLDSWDVFDMDARHDALMWFNHADRIGRLVEALEKKRVAPEDISAPMRRSLLGHKELGARAEVILGSDVASDRRPVFEAYRGALAKQGDVAKGREVFRTHCAGCHRQKGEGHEVGPDLATVSTKSAEQLLESILVPNRLVEPQFLAYNVVTTDGRILDGLIASRTPSSLTLKRAKGEIETVLRSNIETIVPTNLSLMPEGLEKVIDIDRMADLIQFLKEPAERQAAAQFRAGTSRVRITPDELGWLLCYDRHQKAKGVEAELWARAFALEDSKGTRTVLVSAEILGFPPALARSIRNEAKKRWGLSDGQLLLSASHTHNGPVLPERLSLEIYHNFSEEERKSVHAYAAVLQTHVLKAIEEALAQLEPARLSWAQGQASFGINRRKRYNPNGATDPDVPVLSVGRPDGSPIATVFTYACHCTTTQADTCFLYHGDYAGVAATELERRRPGTTALFVAGCGGDINSHPSGTLELVGLHGRELADAVEATFGHLRPISEPLQFSYREIDLPLEKPPKRELLEKLLGEDNPFQQRHAKEMLRQMESGALPTVVPFPIVVWKFGSDLTLVALSGETCVDYALRLKRELGPERTWIAGYMNEVPCYIPSEHVLAEGGYEAGWMPKFGREVASRSMMVYGWPSPFAPGIEDRICAEVVDLVIKPKP